jgi:hypothetical protein
MCWFDGELPEPESTVDEKVLADIREYGWHCLRVAPRAAPDPDVSGRDLLPDGASFAYTIGLWLTLDHPELILVGPWSAWHGILARVVELIKDGRRFSPGDEADDVLDDYPVRFAEVGIQNRRQLLTFADWASGRRGFEALQLILPDGESRWPDDPDYASFEQPLLSS